MMPADQPVPEWTPDLPGVRAARHVAAAAEHAARAWQQDAGQDAVTAAAGHLPAVFAGVAAALRAMADYETGTGHGGGRYTSPWEPCIWLHCAARAIGYAASDMREAGCTAPAGDAPPGPAAAAAAQLAAAAAAAPDMVGRPRGSAHARDETVSAFIHLTGLLDAAAGALARQDRGQLAAILTRQQVRLEQAGICLREALVTSACTADDAGSLDTARQVRSRHHAPHGRTPPPRPAAAHQGTGA